MPDKWIGGSLFKNTRKKGNQPDFSGSLEIDDATLAFLNKCRAERRPLKIEIAGWLKFSTKTNQSYVSLKASEPRQRESQQAIGSLADAFMQAGLAGNKGARDDDAPF